MPIPQVARFGELLRRLLKTQGYSEGNVLEDYFPSIDVLMAKPELYKLRDERAFMVGGRGIGAAGVNGRVWCMNKIAGQLAVVDGLVVSSSAAASVLFVDITTTGLPADGAGGQSVGETHDSRYGTGVPGTTPPAPVSVANDTAGVTGGVPLCEIMSGGLLYIPLRIVLRPNYAAVVSISAQGVGANFTISFQGYARGAEDSELK